MNGREHYLEAERLIALIRTLPDHADTAEDTSALLAGATSIAARAQVHATLSLVAATRPTMVNYGPRPVNEQYL